MDPFHCLIHRILTGLFGKKAHWYGLRESLQHVNLLSTDENGNNALYFAIIAEDIDIVKILLDAGCDPRHTNNNHQTLLHVLIKHHYSFPDPPPPTNIHAIMKLILEHGTLQFINQRDDHNQTALSVAITHNDIEAAVMLLEHGADPNAFLEHGADPHLLSINHENCLHLLCQSNGLESMRILLDLGVDPNQQNIKGETVLHLAYKLRRLQIIELLLEYDVRTDLQDNMFGDDFTDLVRHHRERKKRTRRALCSAVHSPQSPMSQMIQNPFLFQDLVNLLHI